MEIMELVEYLQEIVETAYKVPVSGKIMINKKEITDIVEKIINCLPEDLKRAQWLIQEKEKILEDALKQSDELKEKKLKNLNMQIEEHDITKEATLRGKEIISLAQKDAKDMRLGAREYANQILEQLDKEIEKEKKQMLNELNNEVGKFMNQIDGTFDQNVKIIRNNIKELKGIK